MNLDALYSQIPKMVCKEGCTDCCGPVPFNDEEWGRLKGKERKKCSDGSLKCPHSLNGGCDIYENRPFVCRIFGAAPEVEGLKCPHGCQPFFPLPGIIAQELTMEYLGKANDIKY